MSDETKLTTTNQTAETTEQASNSRPARVRVTRPRIDIHESDSGFVLYADMPGVDEKSTEVLVEKNVLTIQGTARFEAPEGFAEVHREATQRFYERLIRLPEEVEATKLQASVRNGVLTLHLPKTTEAQPIRVQVNAG
ncbi:Hsp20/alpha crystallin family protein [bacterium]|uniref:Heat shock protein Hsp20 n=1 Tax=Rubinisphaera brasiliensis (strain ATCC 49424 / DSM 5305 / JCM 21570 / IAM 15109 / NBRC 103401 / IFAM 1448) TaxID=756272 RepID=F0SFX9_RUBBR|nr:Hsp20/alpha crystallin family protein [Rubinisphaera brasiliensis]ADY61586.1 heat shock protein Hsp20 [Rubinisphaera brasiliensis DSM 5305]MBR9802969.1 Hsp20/alpha crystallin family protein [bacterium]